MIFTNVQPYVFAYLANEARFAFTINTVLTAQSGIKYFGIGQINPSITLQYHTGHAAVSSPTFFTDDPGFRKLLGLAAHVSTFAIWSSMEISVRLSALGQDRAMIGRLHSRTHFREDVHVRRIFTLSTS